MKSNGAVVPNLDRLVHEPARLAILSVLSSVEHADFNYLLTALDLSRGNLSSHLNRLAEADYIVVRKQFVRNVPNTSYVLTSRGRAALEEYWRQLDTLRSEAARPHMVMASTRQPRRRGARESEA